MTTAESTKPREASTGNDIGKIPEANSSSEKDGHVTPSKGSDHEERYLTGIKLFLVFVGLLLSVFLFALDQTIVATAQPKIVSHFNALEKIAWISSAYFLTNGGLMLTVGQILTVASTKLVYLIAIALFELGSLFCAVAPNIDFLIFGRAVAGSGGAGIFTSVLAIIAEVTRLEDRPLLFGSFGAVFAVASAVGPLLGGAFTDHVSWRWCFYINLPFGVLAILGVVLFLPNENALKTEEIKKMTFWEKWLSIDYVGTVLILAFVTSLLLALQWGGNTKPWNSADVIATLVVAAVLLILFAIWEWHRGSKAMLPLNILQRRTPVGASLASFFISLSLIIGVYYLPLWYQAKGASASNSGIRILPFMMAVVISTAVAGGIVHLTGRYWPIIVVSPFLTAVGAGLLFTITAETSNGKVSGLQILFGAGMGGAFNLVLLAVQTEFAREEHLIPQGQATLSFLQLIGNIIGVTVGGAVFANQLVSALGTFAPNLSPEEFAAVRSSVTFISTLPPDLRQSVIQAYSYSLNRVFLIGIPAAGLASISALIINNYNIKERSLTAGSASTTS